MEYYIVFEIVSDMDTDKDPSRIPIGSSSKNTETRRGLQSVDTSSFNILASSPVKKQPTSAKTQHLTPSSALPQLPHTSNATTFLPHHPKTPILPLPPTRRRYTEAENRPEPSVKTLNLLPGLPGSDNGSVPSTPITSKRKGFLRPLLLGKKKKDGGSSIPSSPIVDMPVHHPKIRREDVQTSTTHDEGNIFATLIQDQDRGTRAISNSGVEDRATANPSKDQTSTSRMVMAPTPQLEQSPEAPKSSRSPVPAPIPERHSSNQSPISLPPSTPSTALSARRLHSPTFDLGIPEPFSPKDTTPPDELPAVKVLSRSKGRSSSRDPQKTLKGVGDKSDRDSADEASPGLVSAREPEGRSRSMEHETRSQRKDDSRHRRYVRDEVPRPSESDRERSERRRRRKEEEVKGSSPASHSKPDHIPRGHRPRVRFEDDSDNLETPKFEDANHAPTPWLSKTFEDLPFGPDVPAVSQGLIGQS